MQWFLSSIISFTKSYIYARKQTLLKPGASCIILHPTSFTFHLSLSKINWCSYYEEDNFSHHTHCKKMKFSIKDLFSKCDQIRSFLRIWSHLLKKSLVQNIFCAVTVSDSMAGTSLIHSFPKHSFSTP